MRYIVLLAMLCFLIITPYYGSAAVSQKTLSMKDIAYQSNKMLLILGINADGSKEQGSGFIVSKVGLAVTNLHVVSAAQSLYVKSNGSVYNVPNTCVTQFSSLDLCVLQLPKQNAPYPFFQIGNFPNVGDRIYSISSPKSLENTINIGFVTAIRDMTRSQNQWRVAKPSDVDSFPLIQSDIPILPGSSGGVLLNQFGQAIGVTSFLYGNEISFSIPLQILNLVESR